jgi:Spy/CpxP family protein refolding chaperone
MKKIIIGAIATTLCFSTSFAQKLQKNNRPQHAMQTAGKMKELNLSASQKEQVKAARQNTNTQLAALNKNDKMTVKDFKESKAEILKSQKQQMAGILTEDQKNQLAQSKASSNDPKGNKVGRNFGKMKENLSLTDNQVTQIKANRDAELAKIKAIRDNSDLSKSQKREQLKSIRQEQKNSLTQILSPEQISKLEESRKERRSGE